MKRRNTTRMETFEQRVTREALEAHRVQERTVNSRHRRAQQKALAPLSHKAPYKGPELTDFQGRPGSMDAFRLPSRINDRLFFPCGRVTDLQGQPVEA